MCKGNLMPIYDYRCDKCNIERTQSISITETEFKAICNCGNTMKRIYKSPAIKFNGTGFYTTDKNK